MSEKEKFLARLGDSRANGLVDVKFFFNPTQATSPEQIFAALNEIEEVIAAGECLRHSTWSGDEPAGLA